MAKKKKTIDWQNRIVGHGEMPADQFLAHELNARRHPGQQRDALRGSLNAVGWIAPVIVSKRTGKLLDGHARIEEALTKDEAGLVPFVSVDVDEAEEALILGTFDPITNQATYDREALDGLLRQIETSESGLQQLLADLATKNDLYLTDDAAKPSAGGDDFDTTPEETQTRVQYGDLWQCGEHRVLCGDSTKAEDVAKVMDGQKASGCITDPPYSVNYDRSQEQRGGDANVHGAYHEADIDPTDLLRFMQIIPCDVLVMSYPVDRHFFALADAFKRANFEVRKELIWVKDTFSFWMGAKYQQRHEPILVCAKAGKPVNADVPANQSTVFEIPRPKAHELHPTAKPLELWEPLIRYHIPDGGIAFEPFGGSGTTLIACERTNRKARVIEIEPKYVNVILSRWEAETGREAKLLERIDG